MQSTANKAYLGGDFEKEERKVEMNIVNYENEMYFKISDHDRLRPFFMSIVSDSNHWMFVSSNGGISAGRKNPEYALFPYYTDDKITESADITGSKTIFQVHTDGATVVWEPFSERFTGRFKISRNLYKSIYGNKIIFEEVNHDLGLLFRYQWSSSKLYGFVRKAELVNNSANNCKVTMLDGIQNIMPFGVESNMQRTTSNLADAYKRNELEPLAGLGIYALSAIIVDKAEPSEALKANVAWCLGIEKPLFLVSSMQLNAFRQGKNIHGETDIKGEKGAYFISAELSLPAHAQKKWKITADVNQTQSQVISLSRTIREDRGLDAQIENDIKAGTENLIKLVADADGLQHTADSLNDTRHFSNVLFNIMRGGIFDDHYHIEKADFIKYLSTANKDVLARNQVFMGQLNDVFSLSTLNAFLKSSEDADFVRLSIEYLPLKFSRRHGDPSRPWNNFSINIQNEDDGSKILDYEGNWRDLFQNWEALAYSYPQFIEGMIFRFLNASTFDGYNPYRVTREGFDWETIEPDNPWSYIGYWGDHQIIYLQKFLEIAENFYPGTLSSWLDKDWFVYAAVPYIIKPYDQILKNPKDTIEFDHEHDAAIRKLREQMGADGALLRADNQQIYHVNFLEKILSTLLAKLSNFIPEAGIWLNTQRPEWNDANNALVGNGVSMVTLYYLHRFMKFFRQILQSSDLQSIKVSNELIEFYHAVRETFYQYNSVLENGISDQERKVILDKVGMAASEYRQHIYQSGFWGKKRSVSLVGLRKFVDASLSFIEHSIRANQREDKLYHAYNLMTATENEVSISYLNEMLEGQVAVLSSGYLGSKQALDVLDALKGSALFRPDQYSYILYPNKELPGFLKKNNIPEAVVQSSALLQKLLADGNKTIIEKDVEGGFHFNGNFRNNKDLEKALSQLAHSSYATLAQKERNAVLDIFEKVFNHKAFTGRSGTFYAYEGLGSIYWHMVSKLHLAVQECCIKAIEEKTDPVVVGKLLDHYYEIEAGIGVHKSPELYGAFPTDPYSHTPMHRGAQQPGMTGQVKEDILVKFGELGVFVKRGCLHFNPCLLRKDEFLTSEAIFEHYTLQGGKKQIPLTKGTLVFTFCQVPIVYSLAEKQSITAWFADGTQQEIDGQSLDEKTSHMIFSRTGKVERLEVSIIVA